MKNHWQLSVLAIIVILLVGSMQLVLADAAPPQQPPATSIESGGFDTQVQMVSEEVLMLIDRATLPVDENVWVSNNIQAHVEATFRMQNQGEETESFDVWFPLSTAASDYDGGLAENFEAWVDDAPAEIDQEDVPGRRDILVPWATWPVTFPPGETVVLTVAYDLRATGFMPYGEFTYILETGAGWWGPIGEGTVTVRLPYPINEYNVPWHPVSDNMESFEIDDTDLIWQFSDLEPTTDDNIKVNVLSPSVWNAILAAEETIAQNPDSAEAYLELAQAQRDGLQFKYGLTCCRALADATTENYRQALTLAPEDAEGPIAYLELLRSLWFPDEEGSYPEDLPEVIERALVLAPDDERVLDLLDWIVGDYEYVRDRFPENEILQAGCEAVGSVLIAALEANPDNERLAEHEGYIFRYLYPNG